MTDRAEPPVLVASFVAGALSALSATSLLSGWYVIAGALVVPIIGCLAFVFHSQIADLSRARE